MTSAINEFQPRGDTPIAYSLKEGAKDLGDDGKRHIILVSDGEETCSSDPCQEIRELVAGGISLQIDTVGFGVEDKARQQLSCIAEAGGGSYYEPRTPAPWTRPSSTSAPAPPGPTQWRELRCTAPPPKRKHPP